MDGIYVNDQQPDGQIGADGPREDAQATSLSLSKQKRGYRPVEHNKRKELIALFNSGKTIKDGAKLLQINYSTAKHIIK